MHNMSNLEGNVTYMGEEESNGSFLDTCVKVCAAARPILIEDGTLVS